MGKRDRQRARKNKKNRQQRSGGFKRTANRVPNEVAQRTVEGLTSKSSSSSTSKPSTKDSYFAVKKKRTSGNKHARNVRVATYSPEQDVLVVGDGDFSFSAALLGQDPESYSGRLVATSYDSEKTVLHKYGKEARENLKLLAESSALVLHEVDAVEMDANPKLFGQDFDRIIFNFPHTGNQRVHENRALLSGFFSSAVDFMKQPGGQVHVTLKICKPYVNWNIQEQAEKAGLSLMDVVNFDGAAYQGYRHRTTNPEHNESKPLDACKTFVFVNLPKT